MQIEVAKTAGFCFGVQRAVDKAYELAKNNSNNHRIVTYGPIIHNEEVVGDLADKGIAVVESLEELNDINKGTVIIRSHGIAKNVYESIKNRGLDIVDATCPFVLKIHRIVEKASKEGHNIIIVGNEEHPEVQGIKGWAKNKVYFIDSVEKALDFKPEADEKLTLVSQTTFNNNILNKIVDILQKVCYNIDICNTVCSATHDRQSEAKVLAGVVDTMIVIGGRTSSNTRKLYEICKERCDNTYYIQTARDLEHCDFSASSHIGITAGASTPKNIIEEVQDHVRFI